MKKLLLLFAILLFSGCSIKYNLSFTDGSFNEQIDFAIPTNSTEKIDFGNKEYIYDYLLENDFYTDTKNTKTYTKEVSFTDDNNIVSLKASFLPNELEYAKTINTCFENKIIMNEEDYVYIYLYGEFTCYKKQDVIINFNSNYEIISDNSLYEEDSNKVWIINKDNYKNVDIKLQVSKFELQKDSVFEFNTLTIVGLIALVLLSGISIYLYNKLKKD